MNDFLKNIVKEIGNEYATLAADGVEAGDVNSYIDTGSYIFNALLSGSLHGGLPSNKITALAGESATGKTFFLMGMCKNFLDENPEAGVVYFESESAITKQMVIDRGIDPERMGMMPVTTVQEFRTQAIKVLDGYISLSEDARAPLLICLVRAFRQFKGRLGRDNRQRNRCGLDCFWWTDFRANSRTRGQTN